MIAVRWQIFDTRETLQETVPTEEAARKRRTQLLSDGRVAWVELSKGGVRQVIP